MPCRSASLIHCSDPSDRRIPMSQVPIWFDRKFEFSFPTELYPNLCARLRGTPSRLEEALGGHSHELLIEKPQEKWSAQEHAGHLLDLEPLWLARVGDYVAGSAQLTVTDLRNRKTDEANYNARPLDQVLTEFRRRTRAIAQPNGRTRCIAFCPLHSPPAPEDADAARRPFVFCSRTRRSPSGANLGVAQYARGCRLNDSAVNSNQRLAANRDRADFHRRHPSRVERSDELRRVFRSD